VLYILSYLWHCIDCTVTVLCWSLYQ